MFTKQFIPILALFATLTMACNLYVEGDASTTYLCKDQVCDKQNITDGTQCQSGCCWEGMCNADGKCAEEQLTWAVIAIVVIGVVGAIIFGIFYCVYLRGMLAERQKKNEANKNKAAGHTE